MMMHQPILTDSDDVTDPAEYAEILRRIGTSVKTHAMFTDTVTVAIVMNSNAANQFAADLERLSNEYQGNGPK